MSAIFCANPTMSAGELLPHVQSAEASGITTHPNAASIGFLKILQVIMAMAPFIAQYGAVVWDLVKAVFALFPKFTPESIAALVSKWQVNFPQITDMLTLILKALGIDPLTVVPQPFPPAAQ